MFDIDWKGLALPLAYLMVLGGALMTFSTIYRKRKAGMYFFLRRLYLSLYSWHSSAIRLTQMFAAAESANLTPWFGPNLQRNIYLTLLHLDPEDGKEKSPRIPDSVLKAALLRRAVEDIDRLIQIKSAKQACSSLLLRGSVGDDLWQRFQRAEKEMEEELRDVVTEVRFLPLRSRLYKWFCEILTFQCSGKRACAQLGANHLPISSRNRRQHQTP